MDATCFLRKRCRVIGRFGREGIVVESGPTRAMVRVEDGTTVDVDQFDHDFSVRRDEYPEKRYRRIATMDGRQHGRNTMCARQRSLLARKHA